MMEVKTQLNTEIAKMWYIMNHAQIIESEIESALSLVFRALSTKEYWGIDRVIACNG